MGDISLLVQSIRKNKDEFSKLMEKMNPLMNKYARLLYKEGKDDVYSEMILALWEAVTRMKYCDDDGKCMVFLCTALRNKFLELYKKSRKEHDGHVFIEMDETFDTPVLQEEYVDIVLRNDMERIWVGYDERKKKIFREMIFENKSDVEIGDKNQVSRQYANRLRREIYQVIRERYYIY